MTRPRLCRPDGKPVRVLVVDDEPDLLGVLTTVLRDEGWDVVDAGDGQEALSTAREFQPDAVLLDIMLPDISGIEVLRRLRAESPRVLVLFLTAMDAAEDRMTAMAAGADGYMTKPFSIEEVLVRLRRLLRGGGMTVTAEKPVLKVGGLVMDEGLREVRCGGELIELDPMEFELLRFLMHNTGRVLSAAQILDHVWSYDFGEQAHVVELYINYLRRKIKADRSPLIRTVDGAGFTLEA
ncbi:response regulator transcription factor [Microbispora sp. NBC_01189]|uniref:response regulator transcription factor n=1 Tax=Microbispora sp. NBC_01189 TaxID=2903583 RepID=UPI002E13FFA8|nr:response regulator transcription factor [Microbispora sp. NBC_01189]